MKELSIYNTYVVMESQEQCDRMKQLCLDNGLPVWDYGQAFQMYNEYRFFKYADGNFWVASNIFNKTEVTEEEFKELLKTK